MSQERLEAAIREAAENDDGETFDALFNEWERTYSPRARAAIEMRAALENLELAVGKAFLSIPRVRWIMRRFGLKPKDKYLEP